jgi:hypothetical protein
MITLPIDSPRTSADRQHRGRVALFVILIVGFSALKLTYGPGYGPYGADGNYYFQIARHVAEGRGLLTSVSLYHQGLRQMPQETSIYPLWPLLLGCVGRVVGLITAVNWLPRIIFVFDLIVLYYLGNRMARQSWGAAAEVPVARLPWLDCGHVLIALFGSNSLLFKSTTYPYTEGLSFLCAFAALLSLTWLETRPSTAAIVSGIFTGLAYLTRTQNMSLLAGTILALLLVRRGRRSKALLLIAYVSAFAVVVSPWVLFLRSFLRPFVPAVLLDFSAYRETPEIPPFDQLVHMDSWGALFVDRLKALGIAWDIGSDYSFFALFGAAAVLAPLAAIVALVSRFRGELTRNQTCRGAASVASALTGAIVFAMLLTFHSAFFLPWFFGYRHGLPFFFAIAVAIPFLFSLRRPLYTVVTAGAVCLSVVSGLSDLGIRETRVLKILGPGEGYLAAARYLDTLEERPDVIAQEAQLLSVYSRANFHWIACHDSPEVTRAMLRHLDIEFVLVEERRRRCAFLDGLGDALVLDRVVGPARSPIYLLRPRTALNTRIEKSPDTDLPVYTASRLSSESR